MLTQLLWNLRFRPRLVGRRWGPGSLVARRVWLSAGGAS